MQQKKALTVKKEPVTSSGMDIPDFAIERIARFMLPVIQKYFESEEGRQELEAWGEQAKVTLPKEHYP
jgi:hypothetical protein